MSQFNVSIDPGLSATGFAIWRDGECRETGTLRPPKDGEESERLIWLKRELEKIFIDLDNTFGGVGAAVNTVAVEKFQGFTHRPNMLSMMKCSAARAICIAVADSYAENVIDVNKKTSRKSDAQFLALAAKIKGSEHARDAYQLGIIASFDKQRRESCK
jgi:Holliday junction resolvasome RuvABC endonuclease subunit